MDEPQTMDDNWWFNKNAQFEYRYSLLPRRCHNTGQWVWGRAVRGRKIVTGPGEPVTIDRWYHRHEAVIMMLKGLQHENI
jgi:hypothetical protein